MITHAQFAKFFEKVYYTPSTITYEANLQYAYQFIQNINEKLTRFADSNNYKDDEFIEFVIKNLAIPWQIWFTVEFELKPNLPTILLHMNWVYVNHWPSKTVATDAIYNRFLVGVYAAHQYDMTEYNKSLANFLENKYSE